MLDFQSDDARDHFLGSIPEYITQEELGNKVKQEENSSHSGDSVSFDTKLLQVYESIKRELELYELLLNLKKERNKNKRLPQRRQ